VSKLVGAQRPMAFMHVRPPAGALRKTLVAGVAMGFLASLVGTANARYRDRDADDFPRIKRSDARKQDGKKQDPKAEKKADPFAEAAKGQMQLVVSIANQHVTLYSNGQRMAQGPVSTGMAGHPTPMGVFSIIEKDRYHHSNIYSGAPMPYMERITWSGVALHEGVLPGVPASHGCIRMSHDFASRLWPITKLGIRVIVARTDVTPVDFSHPNLFAPKPKPVEPPPVAAQEQARAAEQAPPTQVAAVGQAAGSSSASDVGLRSSVIESAELSHPTGTPAVLPIATGASFGNEVPTGEPARPAVDETPPLPKASPIRLRGAPRQPSGHVAVFVSRKEKKIFVRQGFTPLFDAPIEITDPDKPLGTHVFSALELQDNGAKFRWNVMTMPAEQPRAEPRRERERDRRSGREREAPRPVIEVKQAPTPSEALARIQIPQETIDRIDEIVGVGTSLVISDYGLGPETGKGTDFVVVTR
jgi:hypothetical protein